MTKGTAIMYKGRNEKESERIYNKLVEQKKEKGSIEVNYFYDDEFIEIGKIINVMRHIEVGPYSFPIDDNVYVVAVEFDVALIAHSNVSSFSIRGGEQK